MGHPGPRLGSSLPDDSNLGGFRRLLSNLREIDEILAMPPGPEKGERAVEFLERMAGKPEVAGRVSG